MSRHAWSRRLRLIGGATMAVVLLASGCAPDPAGDANQPVTGSKDSGQVEFWTTNLKKNFNDYITGMINDFTATHPGVTVNWVDVPGADTSTKLTAAIASGKVPDLVNFSSTALGQFAPAMSDLHGTFTAEELAPYQQNLVTPLSVDGKQAALPWYNGGPPVSYYRKSMLSKAGVDSSSLPTSIDSALELAQRTHDTAGISGTNMMVSLDVLQANGVPLLSADRKHAAFNTPEAAAMLEKFKKYYDSGAIAPGALSKDPTSQPESVSNGKSAFEVNVSAATLTPIEKDAPEIYKDLLVAPGVTGSDGRLGLAGQQVFGIPAASKNQAAAAEFLKFVTSDANELAFCKLVSIYPSRTAPLSDPFFAKFSGTTTQDMTRSVMVGEFGKLTDRSLGTSNDAQLAELFNEQVRSYMRGEKGSTEALSKATDDWNTALSADG